MAVPRQHAGDVFAVQLHRRPGRKGDTVRIMRGGFRGKEGKVVSVDRVHGTVVIEGITIEKVDEKKVARPLHASNLLIVRMDDTDPWRRRKFEE